MTKALENGRLTLLGLLPGASNYTLLAKLEAGGEAEHLVVYKPRRGETPLWDFPSGTLCQREVAAFLVARAGGWDFIPPTVLREGPLGLGAVQIFVDHDPALTAFELIHSHLDELRRIALFDLISNNADRKAGHVLIDADGKLWGIDHGLCFHEDPKLRTVLWDFVGQTVSQRELEPVLRLCRFLEREANREKLRELLSTGEIEAIEARVRRVLDEKIFPPPETHRPYPWPPV